MGVELVALGADQPSRMQPTVEQHQLGYRLYSDSRMHAARAYGIAFEVSDSTLSLYKGYGIDLEAASGESHHLLPVPSVFVYKDGRMTFQYVNPDHRVRLAADLVLAAARAVVK